MNRSNYRQNVGRQLPEYFIKAAPHAVGDCVRALRVLTNEFGSGVCGTARRGSNLFWHLHCESLFRLSALFHINSDDTVLLQHTLNQFVTGPNEIWFAMRRNKTPALLARHGTNTTIRSNYSFNQLIDWDTDGEEIFGHIKYNFLTCLLYTSRCV